MCTYHLMIGEVKVKKLILLVLSIFIIFTCSCANNSKGSHCVTFNYPNAVQINKQQYADFVELFAIREQGYSNERYENIQKIAPNHHKIAFKAFMNSEEQSTDYYLNIYSFENTYFVVVYCGTGNSSDISEGFLALKNISDYEQLKTSKTVQDIILAENYEKDTEFRYNILSRQSLSWNCIESYDLESTSSVHVTNQGICCIEYEAMVFDTKSADIKKETKTLSVKKLDNDLLNQVYSELRRYFA